MAQLEINQINFDNDNTYILQDARLDGNNGIIKKVDVLNGDVTVQGSVKKTVSDKIAEVVANAPEKFDTLKEIADWIDNDTTGAAKMANDIKANADAIGDSSKGLIKEVNTKLNITGSNGTTAGVNALINKLTTGDADPQDNDYYISQYSGGGTTTTTYHRRPVKALWNYIKNKISSVLGLTASSYGGSAAKVNNLTVETAVPANAKFTDTTYSSKTAASNGTDVSLVTTGEKYTWNNKGTYSKPSTGIPKTDLASAVQTSLEKADTALQSHQDISGKLNTSGGTMTGNISYKGTKSSNSMIRFLDNTTDTSGNGISIGGGGLTIIGGGEAATTASSIGVPGSEKW